MLEGITVLNEYPIMDYEFNYIAGAIAAIFMAFFVCVVFVVNDIKCCLSTILAICGIVAVSFFGVGGMLAEPVPTPAKEYQVTIEDYVSINDVYDYYEVVDKDGDIWTIRKLIDEA